ncbi:Hypothetical protein FKW44_010290 [Caligus rogercresseyi]|uniref:Uncharacterized protein n=1 Tax=Caligus rogercresseyi TaxID=217165 RepID=A0A7T8JYX7_CALRO|nr:Hypothetical protein FKW44_014313 [Caligus rogercresseyi]QQP48940.1 Hypothetical protein FKW44_009419 [Caligus rogercresseyi]QQP49576.1 Hypothetical protein FKW44_010290 [Caligus rogercresseyi]
MPHIQDKDFYSFWSPLPSEIEDSHAVFVKSINACSVNSMPAKWFVSAGREHGRRHAVESQLLFNFAML